MQMKRVILALDNLHPETWTRHEVENVIDFLLATFGEKLPDTARIYHKSVCAEHDVTPGAESVEKDIVRLLSLEGDIIVVVFPGLVALPYLFALSLAVAAYLLVPAIAKPPLPQALSRNSQASSPNNELSDRTNRARINGRIPDIYGTVRSTPDLIAAPYKIFENNREVEYAYMCIGRGPYDIDSVRDGETLVSRITGCSVAIYEPYTSPNSYDPTNPTANAPTTQIGQSLFGVTPVISAKRSNSVNGQVLRPPNQTEFGPLTDQVQTRFVSPNRIELPPGSPFDFTQFFVEGDELTITGAELVATTPGTVTVYGFGTARDLFQEWDTGNKTYATADSFLFDASVGLTLIQQLFPIGDTIAVTTITHPIFGNLSGSYEVLDVYIDGPVTEEEFAAHVPNYVVVKLNDPGAVNANWNQASGTYISDYGPISIAYEGGYNIDLNGVYTALSVEAHAIILDDPSSVAGDWTAVLPFQGNTTPYLDAQIVSQGDRWVGPFILEDREQVRQFSNFVASNGLYKDNGIDQTAITVQVEVEITPVDMSDEPLADPEVFTTELVGSNHLKETVAKTLVTVPLNFFGRCSVRVRRLTEADEDFEGTVVDEVRWRDIYSVAPVDKLHFGNVTTVFAVTFATASALAVKERKLNMLVSRKIPVWTGDELDVTTLAATSDVPLILAAICRDKYLGNRSLAELDVAQWIVTAEAAQTYFGTSVVRQFNYTFDNDNVSFEEMVNIIAEAMFSLAYRRGNVIRLTLEKNTENSTLLFNHRNKIPGSEKRSVTFGGPVGDNDGIEYTFVDADDDSVTTIYLPEDFAAVHPKRVESIGVRDPLQGYFHAWRLWNKMLYQDTTVEFDATQEADLLIKNDRILVTDGTRPRVQEGEVEAIDGTELTLSQVVDLTTDPPYTIFLQHYDGTIESIGITEGSAANKVVLGSAPVLDLSVDEKFYARATYYVTSAGDQTQTAFLVTEKSATSRNLVSTVKAINFSAGYYANDLDYINEIIGLGGYGDSGGYSPASPGDNGYAVEPFQLEVDQEVINNRLNWTPSGGPVVTYEIYSISALVFDSNPNFDDNTPPYEFTYADLTLLDSVDGDTLTYLDVSANNLITQYAYYVKALYDDHVPNNSPLAVSSQVS